MNISLEKLKKTHGDNAKEVFAAIVKIHGGGNPGDFHDGGLDLSGLSKDQMAKVEKLLAVEKPVEEKEKKESK